MGRHSLPDDSAPQGTGSPRTRRRTVVLATVVLVIAATGSVVALRGGLLPFGASCDGDSVRLEVIASPDIAPALNAVADKAREDAVRTDGRCLDVKINARPSSEVADSLGQRPANPDFQVWVPDSDLWVNQVTDNRGSSLTAVGAVASSPLALGAVHDAAKTLGWPGKTYSWTALTRAASGGALRLGVADPARSATGLLALARIDAADRKETDSGDEAATRTAATAKLLYERVADGDDQVLATLPRNDSGAEQGNPRRNQALLLSEQAAYAHNTSGDAGPPLDLFYPTDGTAQLTYPYTLVDEDSLTADQSRAANRFMTLLDDTSGQQTLRDHGFRAGNGSADPPLTGKAGGRAPQPFAAAPADPPTSKELQALLGMWTITVQSARITTAVDASPSMALPVPGQGGRSRMDLAKDSLLQALSTFTPEDEIGLWKFATNLDGDRDYVELSPTSRLGDRGPGGGTHRDDLTAAFGSLAPVSHGATGLYDTTLAAYQQASATYASGKFNALVVVTDGADDDAAGIGLDALVTDLKRLADPKRPVPLVAVGIGPRADRSALARIAAPTGGSAHRVDDPSQIHEVILKAIMAAGSRGPH
ncbi:substrate-binding and VWA domain-containing protein [Streptomyces sp. 769]|uniref:substrate-binding and VWA domain-containing protein n=1 Tax=Streptomyces sp. 769 TaxID=1262452 RepID=UPI00099CDBE6|nr:substrate-binding and VWA domain-containing protein [Streptomyces sp. 769]